MLDQLNAKQNRIVASISERLAAVKGVQALVLGGSYARGKARAGSDIDIGVLYSESKPFAVEDVVKVANFVNDHPDPVVTGFYDWGPWVNGGAWLTVDGQRVDLIYRNIDQLRRVIIDSQAGSYELHYLQQPPYGFLSLVYLGEISVCVPIFERRPMLRDLKRLVVDYPDALRERLVRDFVFMADFNLSAFASKAAERGDAFGTVACLARAVNEISVALFALNRRYPVNDKTMLDEISEFRDAPPGFAKRVGEVFGNAGATPAELRSSARRVRELLDETIKLAGDDYRPAFRLPN